MKICAILALLFFAGNHLFANNKNQVYIEQEIFFKKLYAESTIIVKCDILFEKKKLRYKINKVYRGKKKIDLISANGVLFDSIHAYLNREYLKSKEAIFFFYYNQKKQMESVLFFITEGTILVGRVEIDPNLLDKPKQIEELFLQMEHYLKKSEERRKRREKQQAQ